VKPGEWCRRQALPAPGKQKETVEVIEEILRSAALLDEAAALGPLDPALNGILIESLEYVIQIGLQIEHMEKKILSRLPACVSVPETRDGIDGTNLQIFTFLVFQGEFQVLNYCLRFFCRVKKRFTMIGKRERHKAPSRQPTVNTAEYQAIFQILARRRSRKGYWLKPICISKSLKPCNRVKDGSSGVFIDEPSPAGILYRIKLKTREPSDRIAFRHCD
jgi:hypothetical protein